jgi:hypothetical protein
MNRDPLYLLAYGIVFVVFILLAVNVADHL